MLYGLDQETSWRISAAAFLLASCNRVAPTILDSQIPYDEETVWQVRATDGYTAAGFPRPQP